MINLLIIIIIAFAKGLQPNYDKTSALEENSLHQRGSIEQEILLEQIQHYWKCRKKANSTLSDTSSKEAVILTPQAIKVISTFPFPSPFSSEEVFCPASFDGWICWNATNAGNQVSVSCSSISSNIYSPGNAIKNCLWNGQWERDKTGEEIVHYDGCSFENQQNSDRKLRLLELISNFAGLENPPYDNPTVAESYEKCVEKLVSRTKPLKGYCSGTFDGWSCWNDTPAGETVYVKCPNFVPGFLQDRFAYKICNSDGTWYKHPDSNKSWSNYTTCIDHEDFIFRQKINNLYIAGYSISLIALLISLAIFFYYRSLQCIRITIHKNLFVSFILNNIMWIIWYTEVVQHVDVLTANNIGCQMLHVFVHYFLLCNYFWMFCEGLHLHTLMVFAFVQEMKMMRWFCFIGWVIPLFLITVYTSVRVSIPSQTNFCWIEDSPLVWIISGPVCLSMLLNIIFLVNIVRVLVTKLRAVNSPETHQTKKAVRATFILLPLLGLHYLVTPFRPDPGTPGETVYETISAIVTSFQGLCVALLFCFFNGEVLALWRKKWMRSRLTQGKDMKMSYAATTMSEVTAL